MLFVHMPSVSRPIIGCQKKAGGQEGGRMGTRIEEFSGIHVFMTICGSDV